MINKFGWWDDPASLASTAESSSHHYSMRWARVITPTPLTIVLDGEDDALPITPDTLVDPATLSVGARVWVQIYGRQMVVLGRSW